MMNCSQQIANWLVSKNLTTVFSVSGGAIMSLTDAFNENPEIKMCYNHHEQASVMAAEGYARVTDKPGVALLTIGPGATNGITGLVAAWMDSVPLMVFSGQSFVNQTIQLSGKRQVGIQEADIISMVRSVTKNCITLNDNKEIEGTLNELYHLSMKPRKGPVWIEVPVNVQRMES
jgi:acetolactate synthase-1/2/3 large subunit